MFSNSDTWHVEKTLLASEAKARDSSQSVSRFYCNDLNSGPLAEMTASSELKVKHVVTMEIWKRQEQLSIIEKNRLNSIDRCET